MENNKKNNNDNNENNNEINTNRQIVLIKKLKKKFVNNNSDLSQTKSNQEIKQNKNILIGNEKEFYEDIEKKEEF